MHTQPEILEIKLGEILPINRKWVEVVLLKIPTVFASLFVFSPEKTGCEQDKRRNDGRDDIDGDIAAKSFEHVNTVAGSATAILNNFGARRVPLQISQSSIGKMPVGSKGSEPDWRWMAAPCYVRRRVKRLFSVSHNRRRNKRC